ncbi:MAG: DUF2752 domain-containing protein [Ignavibacteria bacterium]
MKSLWRRVRTIPCEPIIWSAALLYLAAIHPDADDLPTLCVAKLVGFAGCPGCGLGASVSYALHGEFARSWMAHPLGIFVVVVLVHRIVRCFFPNILTQLKGYIHAQHHPTSARN